MQLRNYILALLCAAACIFLLAVDNGPSEQQAAEDVEAYAQAIGRSLDNK